MGLAIVLGTRPEIVKMSSIIRICESKSYDYQVIHTGQHYSYEMDGVFFEELQLPAPKYQLDIGSGSHAVQTGRIMMSLEPVLEKEKPDVVLVQGDTNTVLAGAITAAKLHLKLGHVEAGLRSFDRKMPEEVNRVVADHVSSYLFAPTDVSKNNLLREGIKDDDIFVTGNTVADAIQQYSPQLSGRNYLAKLGLEKCGYFLITLHRAENVDDGPRLHEILSALKRLSELYGKPVVFPMHPRTRKMTNSFKFDLSGLMIIDPVSYLDFLELESFAALTLTDSGGVQEESCVMHVPCVTIRENTERPETVDVGANIVAGVSSAGILSAVEKMMGKKPSWDSPYGDGRAGEKSFKHSLNRL